MNTCPSTSTAAHQQLCEHLCEQLHEHLLGTSCSLVNACLEREGGVPAPSLAAALRALALPSSPLVPEQYVAQGAGTGRVNGTRWVPRGGFWERGQGLGVYMVQLSTPCNGPPARGRLPEGSPFLSGPSEGTAKNGMRWGQGRGPTGQFLIKAHEYHEAARRGGRGWQVLGRDGPGSQQARVLEAQEWHHGGLWAVCAG